MNKFDSLMEKKLELDAKLIKNSSQEYLDSIEKTAYGDNGYKIYFKGQKNEKRN